MLSKNHTSNPEESTIQNDSLYVIHLLFSLFLRPTSTNDSLGGEGESNPNWARNPTWHDELDIGHSDVKYEDIRDLAHRYYDWLVTQNNYRSTPTSSNLVAVLWDPRSEKTFASTIPHGPRKAFMEMEVRQPNNQASVWYAKAQTIFTTGRPQDFFAVPIHAEDAAYFNWETSTDAIVTNNLYPRGSLVAVWGPYSGEASHEVYPCNTNIYLRQPRNAQETAKWVGRTPTCMAVALGLGIGYLGNEDPTRPQTPPTPIIPAGDDSDYSDDNPLTMDDWIAGEGAAKANTDNQETRKRHGAVLPAGLRREVTSSASVAIDFLQTSVSCALSLPTPVFAKTNTYTFGSGSATITAPPTLVPAPTTTVAPPSCALQKADPDQGINRPYCVCEKSITLSVQTASITSPDQSCLFSALPGPTAHLTTSADLGPPTTITNMCEVCTRVVNNEDSCSTIPGCIVQTGGVTVKAGSSPVHVGTMTGTELYTSVSKALETLCPTVAQTTSMTYCSLDTVKIEQVPYSDNGMLSQGELLITVESSGYNTTSLRDAIIKSAALTAQNAAAGKNCYTQRYTVEQITQRSEGGLLSWFSSLYKRDHIHPVTETATWCNTAGFAGVGYYGPYWHVDNVKDPTAWIYPHWEFQKPPGGDFACDLLMGLVDVFAVVQPEFAVGDIELGEAVKLLCEEKMD